MRIPVVVALTLLVPAGALAQPSEADERARVLFQAGMVHYEAGEYERALTEFEAAYELSQRPVLLYNIATTRERIGALEQALEAFEAFLRTGTEPPNMEREALERRIDALRRRVERQRANASEPAAGGLDTATTTTTPTPAGGDDTGIWIGVGIGAVVAIAATVLVIFLAQPQEQPYQGTLFSWRIP
jgi:hypothetical protein